MFVGDEAIDRPGSACPNSTIIALANPVGATVVIDSIEIWCRTAMSGMILGLYHPVSDPVYRCCGRVPIGDVPSGSRQVISGLSLAADEGDVIGLYYPVGEMTLDAGGFAGLRYMDGEWITPGEEYSFGMLDGWTMSLRGIGNGGGDGNGGGNGGETGSGLLWIAVATAAGLVLSRMMLGKKKRRRR